MSPARWHELPLPPDVAALEGPIKRAALRVHQQLGPGFRELIYRKAMAHALRQAGLTCRPEVWLDVTFDDLRLESAVRVDLVVEDKVIVELKAAEALHSLHRLQLLSYLKAGDKALGLLFNFNSGLILREGCERIVHPRYLAPARIPEDPQGRLIPSQGFLGSGVLGSVEASGEPR